MITAPFLGRDAEVLGIGRHALTTARYRKLFTGVYIDASAPLDIHTWVKAAQLILPSDAIPIRRTALHVAGLDIGKARPLHFLTGTDLRTTRSGLILHRTLETDFAYRSTPLQALVEVAKTESLLGAVTAGDRLIHQRILSLESVRSILCESERAQSALSLIRKGAESASETRLRLAIALSGLPEPRTQFVVTDYGRFVGRFDLALDEYMTLVEYDGDHHRTEKAQWNRDIVRIEQAQQLGYTVIRVASDFYRDPWGTVERIYQHLKKRGYCGNPPIRTGDWLEVFT